MQRDYNIGLAVEILDELARTCIQIQRPARPSVFKYVTQATIDSLKNTTFGHRIIRYALVWRRFVHTNFRSLGRVVWKLIYQGSNGLEHFSKQFAAPDFAQGVGRGCDAQHARRLDSATIALAVATINGIISGSDAVDEFLRYVLGDYGPWHTGSQRHDSVVDTEWSRILPDYSNNRFMDELEEVYDALLVTTQQSVSTQVQGIAGRVDDLFDNRIPECVFT